eukprot:SAG11_NODE_46_length_20454_cov_11.499386_3_plen_80_part_00
MADAGNASKLSKLQPVDAASKLKSVTPSKLKPAGGGNKKLKALKPDNGAKGGGVKILSEDYENPSVSKMTTSSDDEPTS